MADPKLLKQKKLTEEPPKTFRSVKELIEIGEAFLSPFQKQIVEDCLKKGSGGLALTMGTGKTIISIILALKQRVEGRILVVMSKSLIMSWEAEIYKFFKDDLPFETIHRDKVKNIEKWTPKKETLIVLATPQLLGSSYSDNESIGIEFEYMVYPKGFGEGGGVKHYRDPIKPFLRSREENKDEKKEEKFKGASYMHSVKWDVLIVDEAQMYTKIDTYNCLSIACLCAEYRWMLSGTLFEEPTPERLFGYYLMLNDKSVPRDLKTFKLLISNPEYGFKGLQESLIERKNNDDFVPPPLNKIEISHALSEEECNLYLSMKGTLNILREKVKKYKADGNHERVKRFSSYILAMITYLREGLICPVLPMASVAIDMADFKYRSELSEIWTNQMRSLRLDKWLDKEESVKSSRIKIVLQNLETHKDERVIVFSCFRNALNILKYFIEKEEKESPRGKSPKKEKEEESENEKDSKLEEGAVIDLTGDQPIKKRRMTEKKKEKREGIFTIDGQMSVPMREKELENFKNSKNGILLLTYDVGANGLNLQCCSTILLLDFWWNAGKTKQAIARVLRPGQTGKVVNVYYYTSNTGVEKILFQKQNIKMMKSEELMTGASNVGIEKLKMEEALKLISVDENVDLMRRVIHEKK